MKYFLLFLFLNLQIFASEDCQFNTALELFMGNKEPIEDSEDSFAKYRPKCIDREIVGNAGFIAGSVAIETYKADVHRVLALKEAMCRYVVSQEFTCDQLKIADDVIRESKNPLSVGIAWYRKSRISYFKSNYEKALIYSEIALQTLKKAEEESSNDDGISDKFFF